MPAFVHDRTFRALEVPNRVPAGCIGVIVKPQHGELYAVTMVTSERGRVTASLAIVQAYRRDGALWCRFGFKTPGLVPLCDGSFTADGWQQKCAG